MPSLFRRKTNDLVADSDEATTAEASEDPPQDGAGSAQSRKGYTPSKRDLGKATPKRRESGSRRSPQPPPANRREAYKRLREKERAARADRRQAILSGDEDSLPPRDRGPERRLVRDIVDSRRTVGPWFFATAIVVLGLTYAVAGLPLATRATVQAVTNLVWLLLAFATIIDSYLIARRIKRLVTERYPKTQQRMAGLSFYGISRAIMVRRMRMPRPAIKLGERP